jgi:hypothetical protein
MAEVTRTGTPSLAGQRPAPEHRRAGLVAGEDVTAGDALYLKASDVKFYKATAAAANEAVRVKGLAAKTTKAGDPVVALRGCTMQYGPNVAGTPTNPGAYLYLSATVAGGLADATAVNAPRPVAEVLDNGAIFIFAAPNAG